MVPAAAVGGGTWWWVARGRKRGIWAAIQKNIRGKAGAEQITYSDIHGRMPKPILEVFQSTYKEAGEYGDPGKALMVTEGWVISPELWGLLYGSREWIDLDGQVISLLTGNTPEYEVSPVTDQERMGTWACVLTKQQVKTAQRFIKERREAPTVDTRPPGKQEPPVIENNVGVSGYG